MCDLLGRNASDRHLTDLFWSNSWLRLFFIFKLTNFQKLYRRLDLGLRATFAAGIKSGVNCALTHPTMFAPSHPSLQTAFAWCITAAACIGMPGHASAVTARSALSGFRQSQFVVGGGPDPPPTNLSYTSLVGAGVTFVHADTDEVSVVFSLHGCRF